MAGLSLSEVESDKSGDLDFKRANGTPMVKRPDGSGKWERYSRPSSWGDDLEDDSRLTGWKIEKAIVGVAHDPSLAARVVAAQDRPGDLFDLREVAIEKGRGNRDADMGTALHAIAHRYEREPDFVVPAPFDLDVAAMQAELDRLGLVSEHCECQIVSDDWRAAGTADRIYRSTRDLMLPDGSVAPAGTAFIGDLKTGKRLTFSLRGFLIQLAVYCDGMFYNVETDERTPLPDGLCKRWGILISMPAGSGEAHAYFIDLDLGREGAAIVKAVRQWRKPGEDELLHQIADPKVFAEQSPKVTEHHDGGPVTDDGWVYAMLPFVKERMKAVGSSPLGRDALAKVWPQHVEPLHKQHPSPSDLTAVLDALDRVEAALELPFLEGDPRVGWLQGLWHQDREAHASRLRLSNQPPSIYLAESLNTESTDNSEQ